MPIERLYAIVVKNQGETIALMEQRRVLEEGGEDDLGDDPEMIDQKLSVMIKLFVI